MNAASAAALPEFLVDEDGAARKVSCLAEPDTFTGGNYPDPPHAMARRAKGMCQGCPVQPECLAYALAVDEPYGVWGGLTRRERKALRKGGRGE